MAMHFVFHSPYVTNQLISLLYAVIITYNSVCDVTVTAVTLCDSVIVM